MEKQVETTWCDVCGRKEENSYDYLRIRGWTKYKMNRDWTSGTHRGLHDLEVCVCNKCEDKCSTMHFVLAKFKRLLGK